VAAAQTNVAKLGLFVLAGTVALLGAAWYLGIRQFQRETRDVYTYFNESVQGLEIGSPVKFRGVLIGSVADITVAPDKRHVQVRAEVYVDVLRRLGLSPRERTRAEQRAIALLRKVRGAQQSVFFQRTDEAEDAGPVYADDVADLVARELIDPAHVERVAADYELAVVVNARTWAAVANPRDDDDRAILLDGQGGYFLHPARGQRLEPHTLTPGGEPPPGAQPLEGFVPREVRVQLVAQSIAGTKFLQVDYFDPEAHPVPTLGFPTPRAYVPAASSTLKSLEESVTQTMNVLPGLGERLTRLVDKLDYVLDEVDAAELSYRTQALLETADEKLSDVDAERLSRKVDEVLEEIRLTLASVRRLVDRVEAEDGEVMQLVARLNRVTATLDRAIVEARAGATTASLRETSGAVEGVARDVSDVSDELEGSLDALRDAADAVRDVSELLKRDPSSLFGGKTIHDPPAPGGDR